MPGRARASRAAGFTLIEVLIALLVAGVGLLGLAKMQALGVASAKESGSRGLVSLQASALAATMYSNSAFWAAGPAARSLTMAGAVVTDANATLSGTGTATVACTALCTPTQMAVGDVQSWAYAMSQQFPSYTAKVTCSAWTATIPVNCTIFISWAEKQSAAVDQTVAATAAAAIAAGTKLPLATFSIHVHP